MCVISPGPPERCCNILGPRGGARAFHHKKGIIRVKGKTSLN